MKHGLVGLSLQQLGLVQQFQDLETIMAHAWRWEQKCR